MLAGVTAALSRRHRDQTLALSPFQRGLDPLPKINIRTIAEDPFGFVDGVVEAAQEKRG